MLRSLARRNGAWSRGTCSLDRKFGNPHRPATSVLDNASFREDADAATAKKADTETRLKNKMVALQISIAALITNGR
jgi:hypothetical protein